ncbi:unnamed protein product [Ceratitis capitata]|uniref:(Mediterranean fruit fly) hypothetical protein n=1 Tax=Ceratitis capitata TaxID=7213 RepID=A0A811VFR6_CERCA|nr:unnamed protein product [Ceratitis capitata]
MYSISLLLITPCTFSTSSAANQQHLRLMTINQSICMLTNCRYRIKAIRFFDAKAVRTNMPIIKMFYA